MSRYGGQYSDKDEQADAEARSAIADQLARMKDKDDKDGCFKHILVFFIFLGSVFALAMFP